MDSCIAIVGMNAVGKTNFGKRLASKLKMQRIDTDAAFEEQYGKIDAYIEKHGWKTFREQEEKIVLQSLRSGHVVTLSGGAIESSRVRTALKKGATVLWLQAGVQRVAKHIREAKKPRPEFKKGPPMEVARALLGKRDPLYRDVADISIPQRVTFGQQIPTAIAQLKKEQE